MQYRESESMHDRCPRLKHSDVPYSVREISERIRGRPAPLLGDHLACDSITQLSKKMGFRTRVDGVLVAVALMGCIHTLCLNCYGSYAISATDREYLESLSLPKGTLTFENMSAVASDWGQLRSHLPPSGVVHPTSVGDIVTVVAAIASSESDLTVAARGLGSSVSGQSQAQNGIVIEMTSLKGIKVAPLGDAASGGVPFVEAMGGEMWVDVLKASLEYGLAPRSWTDYLYLTVGGTLSNAGVSGQSFRHGPEVSNVVQLEVVTGRGEVVECSEGKNSELFFAVLGGLGQFGIITKARIVLEAAPQRVRWLRALYTDFASFKADQEALVGASQPFDYVEGFVVVNDANPVNGWGSVPFVRSDIAEAMIPASAGSVMYCLEVTKAYSAAALPTLDQVVEDMLAPLSFHRGLLFEKDTTYFKFLDRVHEVEMELRAHGLWEIPHPWLNIFVPASSIEQFDKLVFKPIATQEFSGPILVYPLNKSKWDTRLSVAVPEGPEEIFYIVAFLRNKLPDAAGGPTLTAMLEYNESVLRICEPLHCKQYLPHYADRRRWAPHFGSKWDMFVRNKRLFDPCAILSPGLNIFSRGRNSLSTTATATATNFLQFADFCGGSP